MTGSLVFRRWTVDGVRLTVDDDGFGRGETAVIAVRALFVALGLIVVWQVVIFVFAPPSFMLPPPAEVLAALRERPDLWRVHAVTTATETVIGLVTGTVLGMTLALLMSFVPTTRRMLLSLMVVSQALPVFAIAPLLVLWFGYGLGSKIVMATIAIFFPVASAFNDALTRTDGQLIDLARLYGASRVQQVMVLRIPAALPGLITGIRLAAVYAPIGALIGEWVGASSGLGYIMLQANARSQTDVMFAALFLLAAMSVLLRAIIDLSTRNLTPWVPETA
ncbi:ABC transporter permease [Bauldia sp.]|uniref:ABC transporter permease n=1 Tax=Bauldia sp. TaxID=2575872 RepID=UPI003BAC8BB6